MISLRKNVLIEILEYLIYCSRNKQGELKNNKNNRLKHYDLSLVYRYLKISKVVIAFIVIIHRYTFKKHAI